MIYFVIHHHCCRCCKTRRKLFLTTATRSELSPAPCLFASQIQCICSLQVRAAGGGGGARDKRPRNERRALSGVRLTPTHAAHKHWLARLMFASVNNGPQPLLNVPVIVGAIPAAGARALNAPPLNGNAATHSVQTYAWRRDRIAGRLRARYRKGRCTT